MAIPGANASMNSGNSFIYLVVDPVDNMGKITVNQLRSLGARQVFTARDGAQALKVLKKQRINMVLSDWDMPVMNGLELLQAMRADPTLQAIPFVMLTSDPERHKVEDAIACGVSSLLIKPYTPSKLGAHVEKAARSKPRPVPAEPPLSATEPVPATVLESTMEALVAPATSDAPTDPTAPAAAAVKLPRILVVDDTPDNLLLLSQILKGEYRLQLAQNGAKALERCFSEDPPDLVLLDVMMPDMDGFEVARRLREHPVAEAIPVIFVTALVEPEARTQGLALGAVDFVTKPFDPPELQLRIRNFMRHVRRQMALQARYDALVRAAAQPSPDEPGPLASG